MYSVVINSWKTVKQIDKQTKEYKTENKTKK